MARIAGITIEKPTKRTQYVRIDINKYPRIRKELELLGAIDEDEFEKECKEGYALEDARKQIHTHIKSLFGGK